MTKYKEIRGIHIQSVATDPEVSTGAWSSGGAMNTAKYGATNGTNGIQTAAIAAGGHPDRATTEQYNGSAWSEVGDLNTGRSRLGGAATSYTASVAFGGYLTGSSANQALTEKFDGTSWTESGDLSTARRMVTGAGTQTAALAFGGQSPGSPAVDSTEEFGGTSWTSGGALNTAKNSSAGAGTQTAAFKVHSSTHEQYNGSSWTETTEINNSRQVFAGAGTTTASLVFGGENPSTQVANTESWNGTAWTEVADLSSAQYFNSGAGSNTSALSFALDTPSPTATEEWSFPSAPVVQLGQVWFNTGSGTLKGYAQQGTGAWSSGGNANTARGNGFSFGSQTAGIFASGYTGSNVDNVENYNGSSWTEIAEVNTARREGAGFGTSTAGLVFGGRPPITTNTESWNGSSWTETADLNLARADSHVRAGTSTDGIYSGGADGSPASETYLVVQTEKWDGSSWTEVGDMNTGREAAGNAGTSSSYALAVGGNPPSPGAIVESWNGSSWTEVGDLNTARSWCTGSGGSNTNSINFGGRTPGGSNENKTESWNGSSWTEVGDMATSRYTHGSSSNGTTKAGLCIMGNNGSYITTTEEWTVPSSTKTLTTT